MSSFSDKITGRTKIVAGRITGSRKMETEGRGKQMLGKMKGAVTSRWR